MTWLPYIYSIVRNLKKFSKISPKPLKKFPFFIKGLAADVGTLQRLPKVIGSDSLVRELALTARKMHADEAARCGLVSRVLPDKDNLLKISLEMAAMIAGKSPVAVQGTKHNLNYAREHSIEEGLAYMVTWNAAMLQSEDVRLAAMASMDRKGPPAVFAKL